MFQLRNAVTNRSALGDDALTAQIESEVLDNMRNRYSSRFCLDDELLVAQLAGNNKNNRQGLAVSHASPRTQSISNHHPIAPWGLILAWTMVAAIFSSLFVLACLGGLDLG